MGAPRCHLLRADRGADALAVGRRASTGCALGKEQVDGAWSETTCFQSSAGRWLYRPVTRCADGVGSTRRLTP